MTKSWAKHTNCPAWKVKIKGAKCKVSWALRLVDGFYTYQLTVDVGPLKKGGSGKSEIRNQRSEVRGQRSELKIVLRKESPGLYSVFCFGVWPERNFLSVFSKN